MRDYVPRIHGAGAELVIVGNGTPEQARWFVEDFHIETPVFTDPSLAIHRAVGARRGVRLSKLPHLLLNAVRAMSRGNFQTRVLGTGSSSAASSSSWPAGHSPTGI